MPRDELKTTAPARRTRPDHATQADPQPASRFSSDARSTDLTGSIIAGKYRILRKLAEGGFGVVYDARQKMFDKERRVALKTIRPDAQLSDEDVKRFQQEALAAGQLQDPCVCKVFDAGFADGVYYLVMEFAEGGNLGAFAGTQVDLRDGVRWLRQAAQGLLAAEHNTGEGGKPDPIYHRDIKPANLLLSKNRDVLVADFGAAKLGSAHTALTKDAVPMTLAFASPEQLAGEDLDHRSDMYSLGLTFYYLLTGELARDRFAGPQDPATRRKNLPPKLAAVIRKMTEPKCDARYGSFADVAAEMIEIEREVRAPRALLLALAGLIVVGGVFGLEAVGVLNLIGPQRLVADAASESLTEFRTRYADLVAKGDELAGDSDWQEIEELEPLWKGAMAPARRAVERLDQLLAENGDVRVRLPTDITALNELERRQDLVRGLLEAARAVRNKLAALQDKLAHGFALGTEDARQRLDAIRDSVVLKQCPRLDELWRDTDATIVAEAERRRASFVRLAERMRTGEVNGLGDDILALAAEMNRLGEDELAAEVRALHTTLAAALRLEARIPAWPTTAERDIESLEGLFAAIDQITGIEIADGDPSLASWWSNRQQRLGNQWCEHIVACLQDLGPVLTQRIADMNASGASVSEAEHRTLADARARHVRVLVRLGDATLAVGPLQGIRALRDTLQAARIPELAPIPVERRPDVAEFRKLQVRAMDAAARRDGDSADLKPLFELVARAQADITVAIETLDRGGEPDASLETLQRALADAEALVQSGRDADRDMRKLESELYRMAAARARDRLERAASYSLRDKCRPLDSRCKAMTMRIEREYTERERQVAAASARFRAADTDLTALRADIAAIGQTMRELGERGLAREVRALWAATDAAASIVRSVPVWPAEGTEAPRALTTLTAAVDEFEKLDRASASATWLLRKVQPLLRTLSPAAIDDAGAWWLAYQRHIGSDWANVAAGFLASTSASLGKRIKDVEGALALGQPSPNYETVYEERSDFLELLRKLNRLSKRVPLNGIATFPAAIVDAQPPELRPRARAGPNTPSGPRFPQAWTPEVRAAWGEHAVPDPPPVPKSIAADDLECQRLYPSDYLRRHLGGVLWHVGGRKDKDGRPVWMVKIDGDAPCLVDVHEVTLGEMFSAGLGTRRDFGDYATLRVQVTRDYFQKPRTLAFYTSHEVAASFAKSAYSISFELPTPQRWDELLRACEGTFPLPDERTEPPLADDDRADVSRHGVRGLRSGLSEWCTDQAPHGPSVFAPDSRTGSFCKGAGFRLCLPLDPPR